MDAPLFLGLDGFDEDVAGVEAYVAPRSPVHARFLGLAVRALADDAGVRGAVLEAWRGRVFRARYERPLLVCAAVRFDALRDPAHPLRAALGAEPPDAAALTPDAVRASLLRPIALAALCDRYVQTNEISRAVAWRWPLGLFACGRRAAVVDLGCSAGLNLVADRVDVRWNVTPAPVSIAARLGLDRAPVDVRDDAARDWLRASIWPGQTERLARFDAAASQVREARERGELTLEASDAADMPARVEALTRALPGDLLVCAYQTVMRDYVLPDVLARYEAAMRAWLLAHPGRTLWCELEQAPAGSPDPAEVRVHVADGGSVRTLALGSGEFHPSVVHVDEAAVAAFASLPGIGGGAPGIAAP